MPKNFDNLVAKMSPEAQARAKALTSAMLSEIPPSGMPEHAPTTAPRLSTDAPSESRAAPSVASKP